MRRSYDQYYKNGWPGKLSQIAGSAPPTVKACRLIADAVLEEWVISIPASPDSSSEYQIRVGEGVVRFTTDSAATQAELLAGIRLSFQQNPIASGRMSLLTSGNTLVLTSRLIGVNQLVTVSGTGLTATKTSGTGTLPASVPPGRFVAKPASSLILNSCRPPSLTTDELLGVVMGVKDVERDVVGVMSRTVFKAMDVIDVVSRTEGGGICVETVDEAITVNDLIRVSLLAGNEGKVTKSTTDATTIPLSGLSKIIEPQETLSDGRKVITISFNRN